MIKIKSHSDQERIGKLDRRIIIQGYTVIQDDYGGEIVTFADLAEVWANVDFKHNTSDEAEESSRLTATTDTLFTVRYDERFFDKKNRIIWKTKEYNIKSIVELGRKEYILMTCELKE